MVLMTPHIARARGGLEPLATGSGVGPSPAGQLLLDRVIGRVPEFVPTDADLGGVEAIAALVDGMPLALELAAAQVGVLGVDQVRRRLERALSLGDDRRRTTGASPHADRLHRVVLRPARR